MNKLLPLLVFSILLLVPVGLQNVFAEILPGVGIPVEGGGGAFATREWIFTALQPNIVALEFEVNSASNVHCSALANSADKCDLELYHDQGGSWVLIFSQRVEMSTPADLHTDFVILDSKVPLIVGDRYDWAFQKPVGAVPPWVLVEMYYDSDMCGSNTLLINGMCTPDFDAICTGGSIQSGITCIAQAMNNIVGGVLLETNTLPLLVGAIGVNPVITGLVGITIAGVVGQTAWFVHRRRNSENS